MIRSLYLFAGTLLLAAACGDRDTVDSGQSGEPSATVPSSGLGAGPYPIADLTIHYSNPDAAIDLTYRVSCLGDTASVTGDIGGVSERAACTALSDDAVQQRLLQGPPHDQACTEIYGGADGADISGTIDEQAVDTRVDRRNGCGIDDWDRLLADLLPTPAGVTPEPTTSR